MYYYLVDFLDEDYNEHKESGLIGAQSYSTATAQVTDFYGEGNIISLYLEQWNDVVTEDEVLDGFEEADVRV